MKQATAVLKFAKILSFHCLLIILSAMCAKAELCSVDGVSDGDTVFVSCEKYNGRLSLSGIDAPEIGQPFGEEAKDFLEKTTSGETLVLYRLKRGDSTGILLFQGGRNINALLVFEGYAWALDRNKKGENYLLKYEFDSRKSRRGMWAGTNNQPPWAFRDQYHLLTEEEEVLSNAISGVGGGIPAMTAQDNPKSEASSDKQRNEDKLPEDSRPESRKREGHDKAPSSFSG